MTDCKKAILTNRSDCASGDDCKWIPCNNGCSVWKTSQATTVPYTWCSSNSKHNQIYDDRTKQVDLKDWDTQSKCLNLLQNTNYNFKDGTWSGKWCGDTTTQTWDCNTSTRKCVDPGTGKGKYDSKSSCQNACKNKPPKNKPPKNFTILIISGVVGAVVFLFLIFLISKRLIPL
jgi:hypothetical protein